MNAPAPDAIIEALGRGGYLVSIICGPSGPDQVCRWSVQIGFPDGSECVHPFAARDFAHVAEIAAETVRRWVGHR